MPVAAMSSGTLPSLFAFLLCLLNFSGLSSAQSSTVNGSTSACPAPGGAHLIVARASTEPPGFGIIGVLKDQILARVPGSTAEAVDYPATLQDYLNSATTGGIAMRALINAWATNCPGTPLVAMGYSQGAQVTADSLVGQVVHSFADNSSIDTPLPASILARTAAVIMMGDPTTVANETFKVGNSTINSIFPRLDLENFNIAGLASRTQSYCDADDPYCATGGNIGVHLGYVQEYGAAAVNFVVANIKNFYANGTAGPNGTYAGPGTAVSTRRPTATGTGALSPTGAGSGNNTAATTVSPATPTTPVATSTSTASFATSVRALTVTGTAATAFLAGLFAWML